MVAHNPKEILVVLGGNLVKENGAWHTTLFQREGDLGDRLRVEAAARLYRDRKAKPLVIVSGGRGKLPAGAPTAASILEEELVALGVRPEHTLREERSGNTLEQLRECLALFPNFKQSALISSDYHLPRIRAFIENVPELAALKTLMSDGRLSLLSAEALLISADAKKWKENIEAWYRLPLVRKLILNEEQGITAIKAGSYGN